MKLSRTASYNLAGIGLAIALACGTLSAQADPPQPPHYTVTDLGTLPGGDGFSLAFGINNRGQIDGTSLVEVNGNFILHSFVIETRSNGDRQMIDLGTLGGQNSQSFANLNASGVVAGNSELATPDPNDENFCGIGTNLTCVGFIWKDGVMYALAGLGGPNSQTAWINDRGEVVGASGYCSTYNQGYGVAIQPQHALLWRHGRMIDFGALPGDPKSGAMTSNKRGQIVGVSLDKNGHTTGVLWEHGKIYDLNDLIPANSPLYLLQAFGINDKGQIVGYALLPNDDVHAFLATPVPADDDDQAAADSGTRKTPRIALPARAQALIAKWMRASHVHGMFAAPPQQLAGMPGLMP